MATMKVRSMMSFMSFIDTIYSTFGHNASDTQRKMVQNTPRKQYSNEGQKNSLRGWTAIVLPVPVSKLASGVLPARSQLTSKSY